MIQGKIKTIIPLLKDMIKTRINKIDFEDSSFDANGVEMIEYYIDDMLNMINAIYQDYIMEIINMDTIVEINLKTLIYSYKN